MLLIELFLLASCLYPVYFICSLWTVVGKTENHDTAFPILCYFSMEHDWPDNGTIHPALNATLCTHIIFIGSTIKDNQIVADARDVSRYFDKIPLLKKKNPALKVLISNGGGNFGGFSSVLATADHRSRFAKSAVPFLRKYGFDGLDIDWEFPGWPPHPIRQRRNFTFLLQELRKEFDGKFNTTGTSRLSLSAAVAAGRSLIEIYDIPALSRALDFVNVMCYDYHAYNFPFDPITGYNAPLYPKDWDKQFVITQGNTGWSSYEWVKRGMPKEKIMVGVSTYTHTWTLQSPKFHGHYAPASGPGETCDECPYDWVCNFLHEGGIEVFDSDAAVPYCYHGNQWVSYDNEKSVYIKARWILENGFGGVMVYSMNNDDYLGTCDNRTKFPLLSSINKAVNLKGEHYRGSTFYK